MAFYQGVTGLNVAATGLDVIGNNIANASTVGYKGSRAEFSDIFASYMQGSVPGHGAQVQTIAQKFTQGTIASSSNALDFSINGNGMFQVASEASATERVAYTRNGEFHFEPVRDDAGLETGEKYIVNANGDYLMGWQAGAVPTGDTSVLLIDETIVGAQTTTATLQVNLDDGASLPPVAPFDPDNSDTYSWSTAQTVYVPNTDPSREVDDVLMPAQLQTYYVKSATANTWDVYTRLDGEVPTEEAGGLARQLTFTQSGLLLSGATMSSTFASGAIALDFTDSTQFADASNEAAHAFDLQSFTQDGFDEGVLQDVSLNTFGQLQGTYSNGQNFDLGTVALASFINPNGLKSIGDNLWQETVNSGAAQIGTAGSEGRGVTASNSREQSNVDLSEELVNMIVMQRNYQANAQMVKTQDEVLRTLAGLR